jgi:hypothetical protein
MKKFYIVLFLVMLDYSISLSSIVPYYSIQHILRPDDSKGIALGLTGSSYNEDLPSYYANPAGLGFISNYNIYLSFIPGVDLGGRIKNILHQEAVGFGFPIIDRFFIGINYFNLDYDNTYYFDENDLERRMDGGLRQFCLSASKLFQFKDTYYSIGANFRYEDDYTPGVGWDSFKQHSYIAENHLWDAFLCDLGLRYKYIIDDKKELNAGVSVINAFDDVEDHDDPRVPLKYFRGGLSFDYYNDSRKEIGVLGVLEYQRSLNHKKKFKLDYWNHVSIGLELVFQSYSFVRVGYLFELNRIGDEYDIKGLTYGLGFNTPKISQKLPLYFNLSYARGVQDYRKLDQNIISMQIILTK